MMMRCNLHFNFKLSFGRHDTAHEWYGNVLSDGGTLCGTDEGCLCGSVYDDHAGVSLKLQVKKLKHNIFTF